MRLWTSYWMIFLISLFFSNVAFAKVRIFTFHYNRPEFVEYQYATFKKFLRDDYEWIVFNDAPNVNLEKAIREVCEKNGVKCVQYEQDWHKIDPINDWICTNVDTKKKNSHIGFLMKDDGLDPDEVSQQCSVRHSHVIQYALENFGYNHDDIVVIMDADVFPIKPISFRSLLVDVPLAGLDRYEPTCPTDNRVCCHFICPPLIVFDPRRLPDVQQLKFHVGFIDGMLHDTGSHSQAYLDQHPEVPYHLFPRRTDADLFPYDMTTFEKHKLPYSGLTRITWPTIFEFYVDFHFIHCLAGSILSNERDTTLRLLIGSVLHDE